MDNATSISHSCYSPSHLNCHLREIPVKAEVPKCHQNTPIHFFSQGKLSQAVFLRLLPGKRKTEARFGEEIALRYTPSWKTCLVGPSVCSTSLQLHLGLVYKGVTDHTSARTPPHDLGISGLHTFPALSLSKCLLTLPAPQQPSATAFCQVTSSWK